MLSQGTTQGDPTAMSIYAIAIIPLVLMIIEIMSVSPDNTSKMVAYADDFTAGGTVKDLKYWREKLCELGPKFGYYPEASKTRLIVKNDFYDIVNTTFKSTKINVTSNGKRHLAQPTHYVNPTQSYGYILVTYVSYFLLTLVLRNLNYVRNFDVAITSAQLT